MVRRARTAGTAVLPRLLKALASKAEPEAAWAYYLLARIGGDQVVMRLRRLLANPRLPEVVQARSLGLLSDLSATTRRAALPDPDAVLRKSVRDLVDGLGSDSERAQAARLIREQVPDGELAGFAAELLRHGGLRAAELIRLLAVDGRTRPDMGRTLLDLLVSPRLPLRGERRQSLDRGLEYLQAGRPKAAQRKLERFVLEYPDHAEGRSALGVCLLELDQARQALHHLQEAVRLEPGEPLHHWNLAAAAKQLGRMGGCYLGLRDYLRCADRSEGGAERRLEAHSFVRSYEKMLHEGHPTLPLRNALRGEELFARGYAALSEGRPDEARRNFEHVLTLVPGHYPSWGNLGAAFLALERRDEALRCLRRALDLNPTYALARQNLALLEEAR